VSSLELFSEVTDLLAIHLAGLKERGDEKHRIKFDDCRMVDNRGQLQSLGELEEAAQKKKEALEDIPDVPTPETY